MRVVWNQKIFRVLQCFYILYWSDFKWLKLHNWYSANHNDFHLFSPQPFSYTSTNSRQLEHFPAVTTKGRITGQWWHCCHITKSIYVSFPIWCFCGSNKMSEVAKTKRCTELQLGWQMWCHHEVKNNGPIAQKDLIPVANSEWPVNLISMSLDWVPMDSNPWPSCFKVTVLTTAPLCGQWCPIFISLQCCHVRFYDDNTCAQQFDSHWAVSNSTYWTY